MDITSNADVAPDDGGADITPNDVDEEFRSLLEGLRTSLPGVQVLFAFLLIAPFQSAFDELTRAERIGYTIGFYSAGVATVLLIAPSAHQRIRAPESGLPRHSRRHLVIATWITIAGTAVMGVAITATVFLVTSIVFGGVAAVAGTASIGLVILWTWVFIPLVTFRRA